MLWLRFHRRQAGFCGCALAAVVAVSTGSAQVTGKPNPLATFTPLGDVYSAIGNPSEALGITPDGTTVVGTGTVPNGTIAFKWSFEGGVQLLPPIADNSSAPYSQATAINADGSIVIGLSSGLGTLGTAVFWDGSGAVTSLGYLPATNPVSLANAISDDGTIIVGGSETDGGLRAFRWTRATGMVNMGVWGSVVTQSQAAGLSGDGVTAVGSGGNAGLTYVQGFRWTTAGYHQISDWTTGSETRLEAKSVSHDGSVIGGYGVSANGYEAFVWTAVDGLVGLGDLPGGPFESYVRGMSANGSVIVGFGSTAQGYEAFYWTADKGMVRLADLLTANGANLNGYFLQQAQAVSADGTVIVGSAVSPSGVVVAFMAKVPPPTPNADWNHSGLITIQDIFDFLTSWFGGNADFNLDGVTTTQDIFDFLSAWFAESSAAGPLSLPMLPVAPGIGDLDTGGLPSSVDNLLLLPTP